MSRRLDKEEAAHLQYETEHTEPPKSRSVVVYMAVLIAAAFCLLLLAYFMQLRTADTVEGLHQSVNSFQTIDQLVEDNRALQEEAARLKEENAKLTGERDAALEEAQKASLDTASLNRAYREAQENIQALAAVNQLRVLYNSGRYKEAIALLKDFPPDPYDFDLETVLIRIAEDELSQESLEVYNPLDTYRRIAKLLGVETGG